MEDKDFFGSAVITVCIIAVLFTLLLYISLIDKHFINPLKI